MAVQRHFQDIETGHERGLMFSEAHAQHALGFFSFLRHSKDKFAGRPFVLSGWQAFWIAVMFGWLRKDSETGAWLRRFNKALWKVARKNGKTTLLAAVGLYLLAADGVLGAEVYSAATKMEQAKISHSEAKMMVRQSPSLRRLLEVHRNSIFTRDHSSKFEPIGADAKTQDGLNPQGALIDELHAHPTRDLWDVLDSAMGARENPLMLAITTAGFQIDGSICLEQEDYCQKILQGVLLDDTYLAVLYDIDDGDDIFDEAIWPKANPNIGVSARVDKLRQAALLARNVPGSRDNFETKHLNRWVRRQGLWFPIEKWIALPQRSYTLADVAPIAVKAYGGMDLAVVSDLCSVVFDVTCNDGTRRLLGFHYVPEDALEDPGNRNRHLYSQWKREGWLTTTPGNMVDYEWIKKDLREALDKLPVQEIAFDRWNSSQLVNDMLADGAPMVAFGQGFVSMNPAMNEFERLVLRKEIMHNGDPVLSWGLSNLVAAKDPAGNKKPDKSKSANKIDPAVAATMAIGRAMYGESDSHSQAFVNLNA
jgi:phage terminase large subunit-like protein